MVTSSEIKNIIINTLTCNKTKLSKVNKIALKQLLNDLDDNDSKKIKKQITEQEWYKILKDIFTTFGKTMLHYFNIDHEPG